MVVGIRRALVTGLVVVATAGAVGSAGASAPAVPHFDHVVVVVLENKEYGEVVGSTAAPAFARLAQTGALLERYSGVAHPSLPNYLALVSGSTQGITTDCTTCTVAAPSLADQLERAGLSWKTYAEGLPGPGYTGPYAGRYAKKHNPFVYFRSVVSQPSRLRRIVPLTAFGADLRARRLPTFSLVVPDLCHDMHDCSVATGDAWLGAFLRPLLPALGNGVVFVVFDEGTSSAGGGGHVPALALGPRVRPGARLDRAVDHYALLRTVEQSLHLPFLGAAKRAAPITGIWSTG